MRYCRDVVCENSRGSWVSGCPRGAACAEHQEMKLSKQLLLSACALIPIACVAATQASEIARAEVQIDNVGSAISAFQLECGRLPTNSEFQELMGNRSVPCWKEATLG